MINWDHAMRRARATKRLTALPPASRLSFAAGTHRHAFLHARTAPLWRAPDSPLVGAIERALSLVWQSVGAGTLAHAAKESLRTELAGFAPGEDDHSVPGQADLVDGALQLLSLGADPKPKDGDNVIAHLPKKE
jgi:hypothetical protein